jgi:hypothetical protein
MGGSEPGRTADGHRPDPGERGHGRTGNGGAAPGPPASRRTETTGTPDEPWSGPDVDPATAERGLRGLVGGGSSQVSPGAALRARDAARPGPEDLARAEGELRIVRRNWTPRD